MGRFKCSSASCGKPSTIFRFDLAAELKMFKVARHQVSRRMLRINKRLDKKFGSMLQRKRSWRWALTAVESEITFRCYLKFSSKVSCFSPASIKTSVFPIFSVSL